MKDLGAWERPKMWVGIRGTDGPRRKVVQKVNVTLLVVSLGNFVSNYFFT